MVEVIREVSLTAHTAPSTSPIRPRPASASCPPPPERPLSGLVVWRGLSLHLRLERGSSSLLSVGPGGARGQCMTGDVAKEGGVQCHPAVPLVHPRNSDAKDSSIQTLAYMRTLVSTSEPAAVPTHRHSPPM
ncbi:hypothetical protein E2C01_056828 [Portunus trituberculatus]|uniref:Uncharacterized protein n=1 Tax=Portunus trituberculatus TaxID=210409 RepID=A0A5B7GYR8_PORTR|nr:hypothetical protein [Portunus trituberculatus]